MRKYVGFIATDVSGSRCEFSFEVADNASDDEIDDEARQAAFDRVEWGYHEIGNDNAIGLRLCA